MQIHGQRAMPAKAEGKTNNCFSSTIFLDHQVAANKRRATDEKREREKLEQFLIEGRKLKIGSIAPEKNAKIARAAENRANPPLHKTI